MNLLEYMIRWLPVGATKFKDSVPAGEDHPFPVTDKSTDTKNTNITGVDSGVTVKVNTGKRLAANLTATISAGGNTSTAVTIPDGYRVSSINIPADWTTANMTVMYSDDNGVTYKYMTTYGLGVELKPIADRHIDLDLDFSIRISQSLIKLVSATVTGSTISTVNQTNAQALKLSLISM